jgi:Methylamine utilization protein MauJ
VPLFQIALRTALGFNAQRMSAGPSIADMLAPVSATIAFGTETYVWHEAPVPRPFPSDAPSEQTAPVLSVGFHGARERRRVLTGAHRLLSALSYHFDRPIEAVYYGWPGGDNAYALPLVRGIPVSWRHVVEAPSSVRVLRAPRLWLALAFHRDGMNSGSPFYSFLAHWNVIEVVFNVTKRQSAEARKRDAFLNAEGPRLADILPPACRATLPSNVAAYLADSSRDAIAHVIRTHPSQPHLSPDDPEHLSRLTSEAEWMNALARAAIERRWPDAVTAH